MERQDYLNNHFYEVFCLIAVEGMAKEEIEDLLMSEIEVLTSQYYSPFQILDGLYYANERASEECGIDIRECMNLPQNHLTDILGNSVPKDLDTN